MFQLRGLGETDCDPTKDPVCAEFYGFAPPVAPIKRLYGSNNPLLASFKFPVKPTGAASSSDTPAQAATPAALVAASSSWWSRQSGFVKLLLVGGGAAVAYKGYQRFVAK